MTDKDYSLDAFNRFFDHAASKGLLKRNTAVSRKAATNKILAVLDANELLDLRIVNLDNAFDRFQNLSGMQYKPDSLQVYLSRAKTALNDFISYVDNPASFKSTSAQRSIAKQKNGGINGNGTTPKKGQEKKEDKLENENPLIDHSEHKHIVVPIPLRENLTVKISNLPADLTQAEAEKLAAIMKAYAVPAGK
jgi:hypothetical protein